MPNVTMVPLVLSPQGLHHADRPGRGYPQPGRCGFSGGTENFGQIWL